MNSSVDHCIAVLSFCDDKEYPERFEINKKCLSSMKKLKNENNYMFLWDNNSSENVKDFIKTCDFFDDVFFSDKNLYDNAPMTMLYLKAKELGAKYVTFLCDDNYVFDEKAVDSAKKFLDQNTDCGYVRILKYDFDNKHLYDKINPVKGSDVGNWQRHFNNITQERLTWEGPQNIGNYRFFKNNWHWTEFPNLCRFEVFEKIFPKRDCGPMQGLEGTMMRNYNETGLKTGVLDIGSVTHMQQGFDSSASLRVRHLPGSVERTIVVSYQAILEEIQRLQSKEGE